MNNLDGIGIAVRNIVRSDLPNKIKFPFTPDHDQGGYISLCHWSGCWNIRGLVFSILNCGLHREKYYLLSRQNILDIVDTLNDLYHHPKMWGNSIWKYDEIKNSLKIDINNLTKLYRFLILHPKNDIQVYFYDNDYRL